MGVLDDLDGVFNGPEFNPTLKNRGHRPRARRSSCTKGHALTDDNIYMDQGRRKCRTCRRERAKTRSRLRQAADSQAPVVDPSSSDSP